MKPDLVLLTYGFPNKNTRSENWLIDEMNITAGFYNTVKIFPDEYSGLFNAVPSNCEVLDYNRINIKINFYEKLVALKMVLSDFASFPSKTDFLKAFRYNYSLIKNLLTGAKKISTIIQPSANTILYAYWADNLATKAGMIKKLYHPHCKIVTRGHGFEIFEEQTRYGFIPFRKFQLVYIDRLYADSKRGMEHLRKKHPHQKEINRCAYVGTKDMGISVFNEGSFSIATCSFIRDVKRLHLMASILQHINFELIWHVIGEGEDLEKVKSANSGLPSNIKIIYHGYMDNHSVLNFYKTTSVNLFVSLSYSEGLPVTMMEAQSFGLPILSTDVGGCREICNNETGLLIERDFNPEVVAGKISEFRTSSKNTTEFRKNCRLYWEKNFNAASNYVSFAKEICAIASY